MNVSVKSMVYDVNFKEAYYYDTLKELTICGYSNVIIYSDHFTMVTYPFLNIWLWINTRHW